MMKPPLLKEGTKIIIQLLAFLIEDSSGEIFKILRRVGNFSFSKLSEGVGMGSEACVLKLDGFFYLLCWWSVKLMPIHCFLSVPWSQFPNRFWLYAFL